MPRLMKACIAADVQAVYLFAVVDKDPVNVQVRACSISPFFDVIDAACASVFRRFALPFGCLLLMVLLTSGVADVQGFHTTSPVRSEMQRSAD